MHPSFWAAFEDEIAKIGLTKLAALGQSGRIMAGGMQGMISMRASAAAPAMTKATGLLAKMNQAAQGAMRIAP